MWVLGLLFLLVVTFIVKSGWISRKGTTTPGKQRWASAAIATLIVLGGLGLLMFIVYGDRARHDSNWKVDTTASAFFADGRSFDTLLGMSKKSIVSMLGPADTASDEITYDLEAHNAGIAIKFVDGKAASVYRCWTRF